MINDYDFHQYWMIIMFIIVKPFWMITNKTGGSFFSPMKNSGFYDSTISQAENYVHQWKNEADFTISCDFSQKYGGIGHEQWASMTISNMARWSNSLELTGMVWMSPELGFTYHWVYHNTGMIVGLSFQPLWENRDWSSTKLDHPDLAA